MDEEAQHAPVTLCARYELGAVLGHGGMATVRDATDLRLGRQVAVKVLRADLARQPRARRRFETEAQAAARLAHPNVVTVFDTGEDDGVPFIVMERLPGRTFADELAAGTPALDRIHQVAREILAALTVAHAAGIIHRDIKPGNVLLTEDGRAKVSDFGIAKTVDDLDQTQTTELLATPAYLAPERLAGEPASPRSDLYSVGVLLYEAVGGHRPFEGDTPLAVMRAIDGGHAEPLRTLRPDVPVELAAVVERAMARDPAARFGSAAEMAAALEPVPVAAPTVPVTVPAGAASSVATVPVVLGSSDGATRTLLLPDPPRPRRRRVLALAVGATIAAAVIVGAAESHASKGNFVPGASFSTTSAPAPSTTPTTTTPTTTTTAPTTTTGPGHGHGPGPTKGPGPGPGDGHKGPKGKDGGG